MRSVPIEGEFVSADLDIAFALLYFAEVQMDSGAWADATRALEEAEAALADGVRRLNGMVGGEGLSLALQLERMRGVIAGVRSRVTAA